MEEEHTHANLYTSLCGLVRYSLSGPEKPRNTGHEPVNDNKQVKRN